MGRLIRRLDQTRQILSVLAEKHDRADAVNLAIMSAGTVKSLVLHMLTDADGNGIDPKEAIQLAPALRQAIPAQSVSSDRRRKVVAEFAAKVKSAMARVAKTKADGIAKEEAALDMYKAALEVGYVLSLAA